VGRAERRPEGADKRRTRKDREKGKFRRRGKEGVRDRHGRARRRK